MSHCWASSKIDKLRSDFEIEARKTSTRQDRLEADMKAMNKKLDQLLTLLNPQQLPKRDLRKPVAKAGT